MRYVCLLLALAGCAHPIRSVGPGDLWPSGSVTVDDRYNPIRPFGAADAPPGVDLDFEQVGTPVDAEPHYLLADGVHQVQVVDGRIVSSELVPGGLPAIEAELFEKAKAQR